MVYETLTPREKDVINYLILAYSNAEIARILYICEGRVATVIMNLCDKYGIETHPKRCKLIRARLEELGIDFNKLTA